MGGRGIGQETCPPEGFEIRALDAVPRRLLARDVIKMAEPFGLATAFRESVAEPELLRQTCEYLEIVARAADRRNGLMHRKHVTVGRGRDVVALQRRGCGKDDIGMARSRRPPYLVDDHGLGTLPCPHQSVDVLMVVEWIAAAPVDQPDVGERDALAVVVDGGARVEEEIGNARNRNVGPDGVSP